MKLQAVTAVVILVASMVACQRPFFAGSRPIGFPETPNRTTTEGIVDRFGEDTTTPKLPIEANGDLELIDRLSKLPIDKQPFWFINWQALEAHRNNPQTFVQRPNGFLDPIPSQSANTPLNTASPNFNSGSPNVNTALPNVNTALPNMISTSPNVNTALPNVNSGSPTTDSQDNSIGNRFESDTTPVKVTSSTGGTPNVTTDNIKSFVNKYSTTETLKSKTH